MNLSCPSVVEWTGVLAAWSAVLSLCCAVAALVFMPFVGRRFKDVPIREIVPENAAAAAMALYARNLKWFVAWFVGAVAVVAVANAWCG